MENKKYIGPKGINDGTIVSVDQSDSKVDIKIEGRFRTTYTVRILNPKRVTAVRPEGMMLFGLIEDERDDGKKRYTFENGDQHNPAELKIVGESCEFREHKSVSAKEPMVALLCSLILAGLGQIYAGYIVRGLAYMILHASCVGYLVKYTLMPETQTNSFIISVLVVLAGFTFFVHGDAFISANSFNRKHKMQSQMPQWVGLVIMVAIVILFNFPLIPHAVRAYAKQDYVQTYKTPAKSMRSTLMEDDRVLVDKSIYKTSDPQRGDVVLFKYPKDKSRILIKRIIAFENESVEIRKGDIYVNGVLVTEPRIKSIKYSNQGYFGRARKRVYVDEARYYVLGDNTMHSHDSRFWGYVPEANVLGKVYKIYWPPERSGAIDKDKY